MPIYEYACAACGHTFEEWQKMSDPPVRTCPKCKKKKVEKLISQTAFQLKGGGWYADLYSSSKPDKAGGKEAGKETGKDSGADSKGGAKEGGSSDGGGGGKSADSSPASSSAGSKTDRTGGSPRDAKKKDTPKKSESRAA